MLLDAKNEVGESECPSDATQQEVLQNLRKCQMDIIALRHKCDRQIDEIEKLYMRSVRPHVEKRIGFIQKIPFFWSRSLLNHPLISSVFEPGEADVLAYLADLTVEEDPELPDLFKIHFAFKENPYFENRVLSKEFKQDGSVNTAVQWKKGQSFPREAKHELWKDDDLGLEYKGFFRWFFDSKEQYCDPLADIIKTSIWYNPMEFYDSRDATIGKPVQIKDDRKAENPVKQGREAKTTARKTATDKQPPVPKNVKKQSSRSKN